MRILYSSNAFWANSGYGTQGKSLLPRLSDLEIVGGRENVAMFAWYGLQGGIHNVEGFTVFPSGMDPYGNDIIGAHSRAFKADVVITLIDAWVMEEIQKKVAPAIYVPWFPVDHAPVPNKVLKGIEDSKFPVTYSKDGQSQVSKAGREIDYIPHGIETDTFKVIENREEVNQFKKNVLQAEDFLAVMVAANKGYPDRKGFQQQLRAFSKFVHEYNNPNAKLYIHTEPSTRFGGIDFAELLKVLGIEHNVIFPDSYNNFVGIPAEHLNYIYNSADVLLSASMGEGFGIPIIEAQSAGTRVITSNFSSMPELIHKGWIVEPRDLIYTPMNSYQCIPDWEGVLASLLECKDTNFSTDEQITLQDTIHKEFSWDTIVKDYWKPFLEKLPINKTEENKPSKFTPKVNKL